MESFQAHPMVLLGDIGQVEAGLVYLEIVCTIGFEIILGAR
jgi:hypothetical protein